MPDTSHAAHVDRPAPEPERLEPVAGALALLIPGLGHAYLGEYRRARLIAGGVLGMFAGGLLVGGIDSVDKQENFVWFLGQAFVGPIAFATDAVHQRSFKVHDQIGSGGPRWRSALPTEIRGPSGEALRVRDESGQAVEFIDPATGQRRMSTDADRPPNQQGLGRVNELGTLFCTLAGMMNLLCVIDASYHRRRRDGERTEAHA